MNWGHLLGSGLKWDGREKPHSFTASEFGESSQTTINTGHSPDEICLLLFCLLLLNVCTLKGDQKTMSVGTFGLNDLHILIQNSKIEDLHLRNWF